MQNKKKQIPLIPVISPLILNLIADYIHDRRATGMTELAIRKVFAVLASFAKLYGHRRLPSLSLRELQKFCLSTKLNPSAQRLRINVMSELYNYAVHNEWADVNWAQRIPSPQLPQKPVRPPSVAETRRLLHHANRFGLLPFVAIGLFAGLRTNELLKLQSGDVNLTDRVIMVEDRRRGSTHCLVRINETLAAWLSSCQLDPGPIVDPQTFQKKFASLLKAAKIKNCRPSMLRWSFVVYHVAAFQDAEATHMLTGYQTEEILTKHLTGIVSAEEAKQFWSLRPK